MKKAVIIFQSKSGTTKKYGEEIAKFLLDRGIAAEIVSVGNFNTDKLIGADYVLLGCWTSGLFFILQHPDEEWVEFVNNLPALEGTKIALFTTYKLFAGSMFRNMKKYLRTKADNLDFAFKSKDGSLSIPDKLLLNDFIRG